MGGGKNHTSPDNISHCRYPVHFLTFYFTIYRKISYFLPTSKNRSKKNDVKYGEEGVDYGVSTGRRHISS